MDYRSRLRLRALVANGGEVETPLTGGGTYGNEQLTSITGVILIGLLAVIGITIRRIGQLISVHLFVGLLLIGPVALKSPANRGQWLLIHKASPIVWVAFTGTVVGGLVLAIVLIPDFASWTPHGAMLHHHDGWDRVTERIRPPGIPGSP